MPVRAHPSEDFHNKILQEIPEFQEMWSKVVAWICDDVCQHYNSPDKQLNLRHPGNCVLRSMFHRRREEAGLSE